jgi:molybdopterin synthase catalytic subunit
MMNRSQYDGLLTQEEILIPDMADPSMGSLIIFEGRVRNHSENGEVVAIEYSAYEELASQQLLKIKEETEKKFHVTLFIKHRIGTVRVGETALVVAAMSEHRNEGFSAVMEAVDRIKREVPIWKKEILSDGRGVWI